MTRAALALAVALALAGCPSFHPAPLPNPPAGATFVDVDGVHVRYRALGDGPAVVLIHGFGASLESWSGVAEVLARHHRVIAIDLKGFGWTSRPAGDYGPAAQATLVWHVLDHLGVTDVDVVAHSWGSSVGVAMTLAQPARVRRVALYDAYLYDDEVPSFFRWAQLGGLGEVLFGLYYQERLDERVPLGFHDDRWVSQGLVDKVELEVARPGAVAAALAAARGHHFAELDARLPTIRQPVLLLWGADDEVTPLRFGERLARDLPRAELRVYPGCGHFPMVEARNPSTRALAEFLREGDAGGAAGAGAAGGDAAGAGASSETRTTGADDAGAAADDDGVAASGNRTKAAAPAAAGDAAAAAPGPAAPGDDDVPAPLPAPAAAPTPWELGPGADLGALGAELTPRKYAAPRDRTSVDVHGYFRSRGEVLDNLDLDRGLDARGQPLFPIPLGGGQILRGGDLRFRTDVDAYAPGTGVAVHARVDLFDDLGFGSTPEVGDGRAPAPSGSPSQRGTYAVIKRGWGEVLTPFGVLAVGRMGAHFGLGIAAHGGDCDDCDGGDTADRVAFATPLFGHVVAAAYDVSSSGPFTPRKDAHRVLDLEPSDDVNTATVAVLKIAVPATRARRAAAGLATVEYGAYVSHRWQDRDVPATYLPTAAPPVITPAALVGRDFTATSLGAWLRVSSPRFRLEAEGAYLGARVGQPSLVPGVELTQPITSNQLGLAVETEAAPTPRARLGVDAGVASGDPAPGFGAFPQPGAGPAPPGSLDGPQAAPPRDTTVDNFRFNPDYHIDQILFREIIGTVTDAAYVRPHAKAILAEVGEARIETGAAVIASWAMEATSTPSGKGFLGVEVDPELRYVSSTFGAVIDYAVFLPGAAFDGATLPARAAQALRVRLLFRF